MSTIGASKHAAFNAEDSLRASADSFLTFTMVACSYFEKKQTELVFFVIWVIDSMGNVFFKKQLLIYVLAVWFLFGQA